MGATRNNMETLRISTDKPDPFGYGPVIPMGCLYRPVFLQEFPDPNYRSDERNRHHRRNCLRAGRPVSVRPLARGVFHGGHDFTFTPMDAVYLVEVRTPKES